MVSKSLTLDRIDLEIDALMAQLRELMRKRGWLEIEKKQLADVAKKNVEEYALNASRNQ